MIDDWGLNDEDDEEDQEEDQGDGPFGAPAGQFGRARGFRPMRRRVQRARAGRDGVDRVVENKQVRRARVQAEENGLRLLYRAAYGYDPGSCMYLTHRISHKFNYFEIEILEWGREGRIGLGLARKDYPLGNMPGWRAGSIGYHADDGYLFHENGHGNQFGPVCEVGDRMGCGVEFVNDRRGSTAATAASLGSDYDDDDDDHDDDHSSDGGEGHREMNVYFTRNGERVGVSTRVREPSHGFYPLVALHSDEEEIRVNLEIGAANPDAREVVMRVITDAGDMGKVPKWNRLGNIKQRGRELRYTSENQSGLAQCKYPVSKQCPYFELEIIDSGLHCYIAIGVAHSKYPFQQHPGWDPHSVAYHADDGKLFNGHGTGEPFGLPCRQGDRMGCGIYFRPHDMGIEGDWGSPSSSEEESSDDAEEGSSDASSSSSSSASSYKGQLNDDNRRVYVYFTRNGKKIGGIPSTIPVGGYFPTVGMRSASEAVKVFVHALSG